MKISAHTLQIMKNFSAINPNLYVKEGSLISTISMQKHTFAFANVAETFDKEFAIYDLGQFLGTISLFEDPDFTFGENSVTISSGNKSIEYFYASKEMLVKPSDGLESKVTIKDPDVTFNLSAQNLNELLKAASILQLSNICVVGEENSSPKVVVMDPQNQSSNKFAIDVQGTCNSDLCMVYKAENLKMIPGDYSVSLSKKGVSKFVNEKIDVVYYISVESNSKAGKK